MKIYKSVIFSAAAFAMLSGAALANGSLCGSVKSGGQPVQGATVTIESASQKQSLTTNAKGLYCFGGLHANVHVVRMEKAGFDTMTSQGFLPVSENTLRLNFVTQPGHNTMMRAATLVKPNAAADVTSDVYIVH